MKPIWQRCTDLATKILGTSGQVVVTALSGGRLRISLAETWDDVRVDALGSRLVGVSDPNLISWTGGKIWEFNTGNELYFARQLPHGYKLGSDFSAHVHWTPHSRGVAEAGNTVNWAVELSMAPIGGVFPAMTKVSLPDTCDGVNDKHLVSDSVTVDGSFITTLSGEICGRVFRDVGDTWSTNTPTNRPGLIEFDMHAIHDAIGSREERSK